MDRIIMPQAPIQVCGTGYDLLEPRKIRTKLVDTTSTMCLIVQRMHLKKVAMVHEVKSSRMMELWTDQDVAALKGIVLMMLMQV
nr:hypothetical protein [Tanacetum cinerariifolium]